MGVRSEVARVWLEKATSLLFQRLMNVFRVCKADASTLTVAASVFYLASLNAGCLPSQIDLQQVGMFVCIAKTCCFHWLQNRILIVQRLTFLNLYQKVKELAEVFLNCSFPSALDCLAISIFNLENSEPRCSKRVRVSQQNAKLTRIVQNCSIEIESFELESLNKSFQLCLQCMVGKALKEIREASLKTVKNQKAQMDQAVYYAQLGLCLRRFLSIAKSVRQQLLILVHLLESVGSPSCLLMSTVLRWLLNMQLFFILLAGEL